MQALYATRESDQMNINEVMKRKGNEIETATAWPTHRTAMTLAYMIETILFPFRIILLYINTSQRFVTLYDMYSNAGDNSLRYRNPLLQV